MHANAPRGPTLLVLALLVACALFLTPARADAEADVQVVLSDAPRSARLEALARLLASKDTEARAALGRAMKSRDGARIVPLLLETPGDRALSLLWVGLASDYVAVQVASARALGSQWSRRSEVAVELEERVDAAPPALQKELLWAGVRLKCQESAKWLVREALGERLETLASVFDPDFRPDVLRFLVVRLPESRAVLRRLTGQDFVLHAASWLRWIADRPPVSGPKEGGVPAVEATEQEGVAFFGITLPETDVVLLLDASASMLEAPEDGGPCLWERVRERAKEVLAGFCPAVRFNVVFFNERAQAFAPRLVDATPENREAVRRFIDRQPARGGTNLGAGLRAALRDPRVKDIVLLSDGEPTRGRVKRASDVVRLTKERRVRVHTLSDARSSHLLEAIARRTGGYHRSLSETE